MEFDPSALPWQSIYKILIGSIVPRPIGWISTVSPAGQPNLAPFSFFNGVCANPPHVLFCPMIRGSDGQTKDTLRNVRQTGEFVVNIVSEPLAQAMNLSSTEFPPEVNEFEVAGLAVAPSIKVRPPRVAASLVQFECRLAQIIDLGSGPGSGSVVIGEVVYVHVRDEMLIGGDKIRLEALR
ncbi:MAG: flavin reductase family protein, partial [Candidatus Tectomicrobia bacterium]|nr:flavin reductase family protein [Candidatus Tectomicrobia bacterium]